MINADVIGCGGGGGGNDAGTGMASRIFEFTWIQSSKPATRLNTTIALLLPQLLDQEMMPTTDHLPVPGTSYIKGEPSPAYT